MAVEIAQLLIQGKEDLPIVRYKSERDVAEFLLDINPDLEVVYEPAEFYLSKREMKRLNIPKRSTVPDFQVINLQSGSEFYLEVTAGRVGKKKNQEKIMKAFFPGTPYIVFSGPEVAEVRNCRSETGEIVFERFRSGAILSALEIVQAGESVW